MVFDDLLFNTFILFIAIRTMFLRNQQKFKYLLVDEFPRYQFPSICHPKKLIKYPDSQHNCALWVMTRRVFTPFVAQQSKIYSILTKIFLNCRPSLEQNYRSSNISLMPLINVINYNHRQIKKEIWTSQADSQQNIDRQST